MYHSREKHAMVGGGGDGDAMYRKGEATILETIAVLGEASLAGLVELNGALHGRVHNNLDTHKVLMAQLWQLHSHVQVIVMGSHNADLIKVVQNVLPGHPKGAV